MKKGEGYQVLAECEREHPKMLGVLREQFQAMPVETAAVTLGCIVQAGSDEKAALEFVNRLCKNNQSELLVHVFRLASAQLFSLIRVKLKAEVDRLERSGNG